MHEFAATVEMTLELSTYFNYIVDHPNSCIYIFSQFSPMTSGIFLLFLTTVHGEYSQMEKVREWRLSSRWNGMSGSENSYSIFHYAFMRLKRDKF